MSQIQSVVFSERVFLSEYFRGGLVGAYWASVLGALSYSVFIAVAFLTEDYSAGAQVVRGGVVVLLVVVVLLLSSYPSLVLRNYELVIGGASLCSLMATVFLLSLGPSGHPSPEGGASPAIIFALFIHFAFLRLSFRVAVFVGAVASAIYFVWGSPLAIGGNELLRSSLYLLLANAVGAMVCRANLSRERVLFKEKIKVELSDRLSSSRAAAAEDANLQKSRLLSSISHDIRTPLHSASLSLKSGFLASKIERGSPVYQALVDASDSIAIVQMTLDHVLIMERLNPVMGFLEIEEVCLNSLLKRVAVNLAYEADALNVQLDIPSPDRNFVVMSDEGAVWQILMNLVRNGLKFTSIKAGDCARVKVVVDSHRMGVRVRIVDTGIGIDRHDKSLIWGAYYRVARDSSFEVEGMGLGLYMTKRTLDALKGHTIRVNSKIGVGSIFTLLLPGRERKNYGAYDDIAATFFGVHNADAFRGCYVLVVCDDQEFLNAVCDFLDELGCLKNCISSSDDLDNAFSCGDRLVDFVLVCASVGMSAFKCTDLSSHLMRLGANYGFIRAELVDNDGDSAIDMSSCADVPIRKFDPKWCANEIFLGAKRNRAQEMRVQSE